MATATRPFISSRPSARGGFRPAVFVGGLGLLIAVGYAAASVLGALSAPDHFDRTTIGGSLTVEVDAAGPVVVYVEASRAVLLAELALTVTDASGREVVVDAYGADLRYDRAGGLGTAVGSFDAEAPGRFQLDSAAPLGTIAIAVGPDIGTELQAAIGRAGLVAGIGLLAGLALAAFEAARAR
ncbi:MAG TPA: hypothetical protein VFX65_11795 [Candidatus Limnocylindrales bacterium]|nr:hypothetical protein [Candidatus Limnocylindrales bacterium]